MEALLSVARRDDKYVNLHSVDNLPPGFVRITHLSFNLLLWNSIPKLILDSNNLRPELSYFTEDYAYFKYLIFSSHFILYG